MAPIRKNFVTGIVPGVTGPNGLTVPILRADKDALQKWLAAVTKIHPQEAVRRLMARPADGIGDVLDVVMRHHGGTVVMCVAGEVSVYTAKNLPVTLPRRMITSLGKIGMTQDTPVVLFKNAYVEPASDESLVKAGQVIRGLPATPAPPTDADLTTPAPPASAFSSENPSDLAATAESIVDKLTGS